jgi:hypothetical protein
MGEKSIDANVDQTDWDPEFMEKTITTCAR